MANPEQMVFVGKGPIIMGEYDPVAGVAHEGYLVRQKRIGCGNRTLKISLSREKGKVVESCSGQNLTLKTWGKSAEAMISLEMVQFSRDELALALYGQTVSRAAGTVTAEAARDDIAVGEYLHTRHPNISSVVVKDSAGTPATLVAGTHYEVDSAAHGRLKILDLGAFTQPFVLDYSYEAYGQVTAFTAASTRRGLIFDGINVAEANAPVRVFVPLIDFDPTKDFNWLSDDEVTLALDGEILYADALAANTDFGPFFRVDALPV